MPVYLEHILDPLLERSRSQKLAVLGGLLAIQITAYYAVFYGPQAVRIESLARHVARLRAQTDGQAELASQRASLEDELAALDQQLGGAVFRLPPREQIASLLATIAEAARAADLAVRTLRPRPERIREFYVEVPVDVVLIGAYQHLFNFLRELARLEDPLNVTQIEIGRPTTVNGEIVLQTSAQITALRRLSDKAQESPEGSKDAGEMP